MKKKLMTLFIALGLLLVTIYSATAIEIETITNTEVHVGTQFSYDVNLVNTTGVGTLTYNLINKPENMSISTTGQITWLPKLKQTGTHTVLVNVSNNTHSDTETFEIEAKNDAFTFSLNTASAPKSAVLDQEYEFTPQATSNYPLAVEEYVYTFVEGPTGMAFINGELIWTPTVDQIGTHTVKITAIPKNAPTGINALTGEYTIEVQGLSIDRVEVRSDSRRLETISRTNYLDGSTPYTISRDANLGDTIELIISIRNNLPSETDNELRDVELEIFSYDLVDADGSDTIISRIRPGRTEEETISFYIDPKDLHPDDSPFEIEIRATGETRTGDMHSDTWFLELRLESKSYDLLMTDVTTTPETVCANQRVRLNFDLRNIGSRDLTSAGIRFYASGLGIDEWERNIRIDYDETRPVTKFLTIPANTVPGEYFIEIVAYPRTSSTSDSRTELSTINVRDCQPTTPEEEEEEQPPIIITPPQEVVVPGKPVKETTGTTSRTVFDRDGTIYIILLTALVVLLLIGVIALLVKAFK